MDSEITCLKDERLYTFGNIKLRSYCTEVHQIYTQYSHIITDERFRIRMAIFQAVAKCQENE